MTIFQQFIFRIFLEALSWVIMKYQITSTFTIAGIDDPEPAKWWQMKFNQNDHSQIFITPEHWDRSLSMPDMKIHTPLNRGSVIKARWSPILLIITDYKVLGNLPSSLVAPDISPNWKEIDRQTSHSTFQIIFLTSTILLVFFTLGFLVGQLNFWFPTIDLLITLYSGFGWWKTRNA